MASKTPATKPQPAPKKTADSGWIAAIKNSILGSPILTQTVNTKNEGT